jgi:AcrR family transcriptional regulator
MVAAEGVSSLSIEGIATNAGVSKTAIYRRWSSTDEIVVDAVARIAETVEVPDTGHLRDDLVEGVSGLRRLVSDTRAGAIFPWLVSEIANRSDVGARYFSTVVQPRRLALMQVIRGAQDRGEIDSELDIETAVDMVTGPVILRRMTGRIDTTDDTWVASLVDALLEGWLGR